jgi:hypothetical protein
VWRRCGANFQAKPKQNSKRSACFLKKRSKKLFNALRGVEKNYP